MWSGQPRKVEDSAPDVRLKKKKDTLRKIFKNKSGERELNFCACYSQSCSVVGLRHQCQDHGWSIMLFALHASMNIPHSLVMNMSWTWIGLMYRLHEVATNGEELCNKWKNGQDCVLGRACPYAHGEKELGTVELVVCGRVKTRICKFWTTGNCRRAKSTGVTGENWFVYRKT